jgi:hypothetical protein
MKQLVVSGLVLLLLSLGGAWADPKGIIPPGVLPNNEAWFKQPKIRACCAEADGYAVFEYKLTNGAYFVPHPETGEIIQIPPEALVYDSGNPTGYAWIWFYPDGKKVRCFVPNTDA